jgi:tagaturonate reductase
MHLSRQILHHLPGAEVDLPSPSCFDLPEKVLQFGTGVLLRGLPDYFIDNANKKGIFNGRVVVVKSTSQGDTGSFASQDFLYTQCVRGWEDGKLAQQNIVNASISRILNAASEWQEILSCAANRDLRLIISNTTEVGIRLPETEEPQDPPPSFPGKLLAFLHKRYQAFDGDPARGLIIVPTELVPDNGKLLKQILMDLAERRKLGEAFEDWLIHCNNWCSSLVDRIVPGKPPQSEQDQVEAALGYQDACMIMSEPYRLWAIETDSPACREQLSFASADAGVVIAADITKFRELKLRLLNSPHTFCCGLAMLWGFLTVKEAMTDSDFKTYMSSLMDMEIIPSILGKGIERAEASAFAERVLERFGNPFIEHPWINITLQYTSKMKMRNVPLILEYVKRFGKIPEHMALGFAAHILFMQPVGQEAGKQVGMAGGKKYSIHDDFAEVYARHWKEAGMDRIAASVLADNTLWGTDLSALPGLTGAVQKKIETLHKQGAASAVRELHAATI